MSRKSGMVTLVGAGPGTADLLTLAALKAIQQADVVLYDALLTAELLDLIPKRAKAVYTGKRCGKHALKQEQINALLVSYAAQGRSVVRLKGGDPFIFGRGSEEVAALREAGISYRIIPGVSALNGIAAQAGLPLTSRTHANEFRVIQGHFLPEEASHWRELASYAGTLVIFMGGENWPEIARRLIAAGLAASVEYAVIETAPSGELVISRGSVGTVAAAGFSRRTSGPAIIYLGANVALMDAQAAPAFSGLVPHAKEDARVVAFTHFY